MKIFKVSLLVLLLALALPGVAFAAGSAQDAPAGGFTIPEVFGVALLGVVTYWIVEGLKMAFPNLTGFGPQLAAVLVAMLLTQITRLINLFVPPSFTSAGIQPNLICLPYGGVALVLICERCHLYAPIMLPCEKIRTKIAEILAALGSSMDMTMHLYVPIMVVSRRGATSLQFLKAA